MKVRATVFSGLLFLVLSNVIAIDQVNPPAKADNNGSLEAKVDAYVKPFIDMRAFSGSILIAKGGRVLLSKGYGMANYELGVANTPKTKFHIASISKPFTAAAIMILAERELVSVSDPLTKYIPDYPNGDKITVHHLLTHTSGIQNANGFPEYDAKSKFPQTTAALIEMFKKKPLLFQPGEKYSYSNSNYNVLAYIIEKMSGKGYGEFLKENIFDPLDMRDTAHDGTAGKLIENRASGYSPVGTAGLENSPYLDWTIKTGNGSLYSTVEDLYKWDRALYTEKILKKSALEKIFKESYGWFTGKRFNRNVIRINGRSPGFQGEVHRYTDEDACVIVLSNNYGGTASFMINDVAAILLGEKYEITEIDRSVRPDEKTVGAYLGRYQGDANFVRPNAILTVEKKGDDFSMRWSTGATSGLHPLSEGKFYDRSLGGTLVFVKDDEGRVSHLTWSMGTGQDYRANRISD